jgi:hypothetical protein
LWYYRTLGRWVDRQRVKELHSYLDTKLAYVLVWIVCMTCRLRFCARADIPLLYLSREAQPSTSGSWRSGIAMNSGDGTGGWGWADCIEFGATIYPKPSAVVTR